MQPQPQWIADLSEEKWARLRRGLMRIGMVCPYCLDVPGGVQAHVPQLAEVMRERGHDVSVLALGVGGRARPAARLRRVGRKVPIPYNGSVARLRFGPATHRKVKKWITRATSTYCTCTSRTRRACRCTGPAGSRRTDRRHLSHLDHEVVDAQRLSGHPAPVAREDRRPDRRLRLARRWQMEAPA